MVYAQDMIDRIIDFRLVRAALKRSRVVALLGPRQCGKTTLARQFVGADSLNYFDLEDPRSVARLSERAVRWAGLTTAASEEGMFDDGINRHLSTRSCHPAARARH